MSTRKETHLKVVNAESGHRPLVPTTDRNLPGAAVRSAAAPRVPACNDPCVPAEQVLVDWMLSVQPGVNLEAAARRQIALIDRRAVAHPEVQYLRTLFVAIAGECTWRGTFTHL